MQNYPTNAPAERTLQHPCQNQEDERAFIPTRSPVLLSKNYALCIEHYALTEKPSSSMVALISFMSGLP